MYERFPNGVTKTRFLLPRTHGEKKNSFTGIAASKKEVFLIIIVYPYNGFIISQDATKHQGKNTTLINSREKNWE